MLFSLARVVHRLPQFQVEQLTSPSQVTSVREGDAFTLRPARLLLICLLIACVYAITYNADIETGDTRQLFDAVSSLADWGDTLLDQSAWQFPPNVADVTPEQPLQNVGLEPLPIVLALPLYWLARLVPSLGLVHTVWLFNLFVCTATCAIFYVYTRQLGYNERVASLSAIMLGVGSILWPYSKTLFREPLLGLLLLLSAYFLERLRAARYQNWTLIGASMLCLVGIVLVKASAILALPALAMIGLPTLRRMNLRLIIGVVITLIIIAVVFLLAGELLGLNSRYNLFSRLPRLTSPFLPEALAGMLLSPGSSVWGTSPILLLTLPGAYLLLRRRQFRYVGAGLLLVGMFAVGYALLSGGDWFGGLSWPPRFLVPVVPFAFLMALPALARTLQQPRSWWRLAAAIIFAYAFWVQLSAVTLNWTTYARALPPEANGLLEWSGGLYQPAYFRWVVIPQLWTTEPLHTAWMQAALPFVPYLFAGLLALCLFFIWKPPQHERRIALVVGVAFCLVMAGGLFSLKTADPRYRATDEGLQTILPILESETRSDDIVLLSNPRYDTFFMNASEARGGRIITLPQQPGEQPGPAQPPQVRSDNPEALLTPQTLVLLETLAASHDRLWLLIDSGPYIPWATRPVEHYVSTRYFPVQVLETSPTTRLIEYATAARAPTDFDLQTPDYQTDLAFEGTLQLRGFDLPLGTAYAPGDALPIATQWLVSELFARDATFAVYLSNMAGQVVAQTDGLPSGGFRPTSTWRPFTPVWDARALRLPSDLPAGNYQLWVKVYTFEENAPVDLPVTSGTALEEVIGVLPVSITVR